MLSSNIHDIDLILQALKTLKHYNASINSDWLLLEPTAKPQYSQPSQSTMKYFNTRKYNIK